MSFTHSTSIFWVTFGVSLMAICFIYFTDEESGNDMSGKRVLITGSSSGIGEQLAYRYSELGASIVLAARRDHLLRKVVKKCKDISPNNDAIISFLAIDLSMDGSALSLIQHAEAKMGGIDILILNHVTPLEFGFWYGSPRNLTTMDKYIQLNFISYVHLTSHALKQLHQNDGRIIIISSVAGKIGTAFQHSYAAAKFALDGFFSSLRTQFQFTGVRISVTMCIIGGVETEMLNAAMDRFEITRAMKWFPLENPADVARAIVTAGSKRLEELYYPFSSRVITNRWFNRFLFRRILPKFVQPSKNEFSF